MQLRTVCVLLTICTPAVGYFCLVLTASCAGGDVALSAGVSLALSLAILFFAPSRKFRVKLGLICKRASSHFVFWRAKSYKVATYDAPKEAEPPKAELALG